MSCCVINNKYNTYTYNADERFHCVELSNRCGTVKHTSVALFISEEFSHLNTVRIKFLKHFHIYLYNILSLIYRISKI